MVGARKGRGRRVDMKGRETRMRGKEGRGLKILMYEVCAKKRKTRAGRQSGVFEDLKTWGGG